MPFKNLIAEHFLQHNQGKTDILIIDPGAQRVKHLSKLQVVSVNPFNQVNNLYVIFDSELNFVYTLYVQLCIKNRILPFKEHRQSAPLSLSC